jgi:transposase-like protein
MTAIPHRPALASALHNLITLYGYTAEICKVMYTTNAIESLNSVIRKATRKRKIFPHDQSALKVVYLATQ